MTLPLAPTFQRGVSANNMVRYGIMLAVTLTLLPLMAGGVLAAAPETAEQAYHFQLVNQDGQSVRLEDFRGKTVLVSYIFTRCPMPTMCSLVTSKMAQVQAQLNTTLKDRVVLVSMTFDPAYDTPTVLKEYGQRYGADFSNWQFLTGDAAEIQTAVKDANVIYEDMHDGNFTHNMNTVLIGPDGTVRQRFRGSAWKVQDIVDRIRAVAQQSAMRRG